MEPFKSTNYVTTTLIFFLEISSNGLYQPLTHLCARLLLVRPQDVCCLFTLNGNWWLLFFQHFLLRNKTEHQIMHSESFLWQIPPLDCPGDEAAGDFAKLTHKMWSPSALMKYLWFNRLVIFDFLLTVVSRFASLCQAVVILRLRVWFSSQVWQAVYPRLVFAPKSDARLQKGMAWLTWSKDRLETCKWMSLHAVPDLAKAGSP